MITVGLLTDAAMVLLRAEQAVQDDYRTMFWFDFWRLMQIVCQA